MKTFYDRYGFGGAEVSIQAATNDEDGRCDVCEKLAPVAVFDTSSGEYQATKMCGDCLRKLIAEVEAAT